MAIAFLDALPAATAGCIVTDVRMPGIDGMELLRRLQESGIPMPVIVMTGHGDVPLAVEAMKLGAVDFLEKPFDDNALLSAVRTALSRNHADSERESRKAEIQERLTTLSPRERQVLEGLVAGHPNKTIAFDLGISARTVEVYRANVMTKMQRRQSFRTRPHGAAGQLLTRTALDLRQGDGVAGMASCASQSANVRAEACPSLQPRWRWNARFSSSTMTRRSSAALKFALEIEGFAVSTFPTADALMADGMRKRWGCLVIDYNLPETDGLHMLAELRDHGVTMPAILITSNPGPQIRQRAAAAGVPIVEKPLIGNGLIDAIRNAFSA